MALTKIKGAGVNISATEKLYFDDGGNTYIYESGADVLDVYVGGANMVKLTESTTDTVTVTGDLTVGVDGTGHDVKFFGDTASAYMLWDQSADDLVLAGAAGIDLAGDIDVDGTANLDVVDIDGAVNMAADLTMGANILMADDTSIGIADDAERIEFDGSGDISFLGCNVGIGDSDPSEAKLSITGVASGDTGLLVDQDQNRYAIEIDHEGTSYSALKIASANTTGAVIDATSIDALTTGMIASFHSDSDDNSTRNLVQIVNDHTSADNTVGLLIQQDGADASIELTGNGSIKFPGTQGASSDANSLDDYEEGYYTATLTCGSSGTVTVNGSYDQLAYTKIGRMVWAQGALVMSAVSSPTGTLALNLPFTATNLTEAANYTSGTVSYSGMNALKSAAPLVMRVADSDSSGFIKEWTTTEEDGADTAENVTASTVLFISYSYVAE